MSDPSPTRTARSERARAVARWAAVVAVVVLQLGLVVRAYWAPHKEFGFQMFPEASAWQAEIVRITDDGARVPVDQPWSGYRWDELVTERGLQQPWVRRHADAGLDNQLAFLQEALEWVAANTPQDDRTRYLEATVTTWFNGRAPEQTVLRSQDRARP